MLSFKEKVIKLVSKIPRGKILAYKQVATLAGKPKASRAVGNILNKYYKQNGPKIPCHRVIHSDGKIGGYVLGAKSKEILLIREGIKNKKIDQNNVLS